MSQRYPSASQKKIIWTALTGLAMAALAGVIMLFGWVLLKVLGLIYPVLLPLGVAAVVAYILDPALDWIEKILRVSRHTSLLILFATILLATILFFVLLAPPLVGEVYQFVTSLPQHIDRSRNGILSFLDAHPQVKDWTDAHLTPFFNSLPARASSFASHLGGPVQQFFSWIGFVIGFLFVPLYVYYFLLEKKQIADHWKEYLPLHRSWWRDEVVLVLSEINNYLILFFRGQVVVGACVGILTAIGLTMIGLKYGLLLGLLTGALGLVPYLGIISTLVPALLIGYSYAENPTDMWLKPVLVLGVYSAVQMCEGFFISPRIMGHRTGLHPVTVIISILVWSLILPGLLGPILAVPLTATLRVLMYRYVWLSAVGEKPQLTEKVTEEKASAPEI